MLSQKISKVALLLAYQYEERRLTEIDSLVRLWVNTHEKLKNSPQNSTALKQMYAQLSPLLENIERSVITLHTLHQTHTEPTPTQIQHSLGNILKNEPLFLDLMNKITFQLDKEASTRLQTVKKTEWIMMGVTLMLLLLEALLIFRPTTKAITIYLHKIETNNQLIQEQNNQLETTQEKLRQNIAELQTVNEELNSTVEELNITIETVDEQKQLIALANQRMHASIKYGKKIQEAILPTEQEMRRAFQDYFVIYMPRDTVSGDFYWYHKLDETTQYIAVVDCTGHGVPGAFMSMIGYSLLNQILSETKITASAEILHYLDIGIVQGLRQFNTQNVDGMDVCFCRLDALPNNQVLVDYAGAKRPLFYSDGQDLRLIRPTRESIGGFCVGGEERTFQSQQIKLDKGEVLYLTTDGFADNPNKNRKRFGEERFTKLLQAVVDCDMKDQEELIMSAYHAHQEGIDQRDDITIVGVRI